MSDTTSDGLNSAPSGSAPAKPGWVAVVRDLLFSSKISASSRATGIPVQIVRDPAKLVDLSSPARGLIVDLGLPGALEGALAWKARVGGQVVGFVSHTAVEVINRARGAGVDQVISNGALSSQMDRILQGEFQEKSARE